MYYPIGDIHGDYENARRLYDRIIEEIDAGIDPAFGGTIVFLGDYIDRGPDSKRVMDFVMGLEDRENVKHIFLKGNHEDFMTYCRHNPRDYKTMDMWQFHGGEETLAAFGVTVGEFYAGALDKYVEWIDALPLIAHDPDYVFVHAGIDPNIPLAQQNAHDMMWEFHRDPETYTDYRKIVIHGHSMKKGGPIIALRKNRIYMDNGMNLFHDPATVCLPEPYEPGVYLKVLRP